MRDSWNSMSSNSGPNYYGNYFHELPRLNSLRRVASPDANPTTGDLVHRLDYETQKAGFDPVGALHRGVTADVFFRGNQEFNEIEKRLAHKIGPHNVTEVFDLIKFAGHYTPTGQVIGAFYTAFQDLFHQRTFMNPKGMDPGDLGRHQSPFKQAE